MPAIAVPLHIGQPERHFDREARVLPGTVAAPQAANLLVAHLLQRLAGQKAAGPARTVKHHVGIAVRNGLLDTQLEVSPGDLLGAGENALIRLVFFTYVDDHRTAPLHLLGELAGRHLRHLRPGRLEQFRLRLRFGHGPPGMSISGVGILARRPARGGRRAGSSAV
jgi:hypothetical protein